MATTATIRQRRLSAPTSERPCRRSSCTCDDALLLTLPPCSNPFALPLSSLVYNNDDAHSWSAVSRRDRYRARAAAAAAAAANGGDGNNAGAAAAEEQQGQQQQDDGDDDDNPLPGFIDPVTLEAVVNPAISPDGYVMGLATWRAVLSEAPRCPFTKRPLRAEQLVALSRRNVERFRPMIVRL